VIGLHLPPLRERREDIPAIAAHFLAFFAERHARPTRALSEAARRILLAHDWPGNVRELRNAVERAVVLAEGETIEAADLPPGLDTRAPLGPVDAALADLSWADARARAMEAWERGFLAAALERHGGNVSRTAQALGIHRQSLQKRLRQIGLERD
jgi:DNA-binding NtrC family response regulator